MATCAACRQPLPAGARFCPACGYEVLAAAEERRVVTVVFADLVGYTSLSEHLDPERVKRLIDAAFERLIAVIVEFGGVVDKVLGDGILALFGAPVAHEDDADRAIRAALAMHDELARFVDRQPDRLPEGVHLQLRIGVNTGEVLVGAISGTGDYTAMGDVVNVASRVESLAAPGEVYIGDATAALASDEIQREVVDTFGVRGRERTERVWRVTGRRLRLPSLTGRADVPFVGRQGQRELLASVMAMVVGGRSVIVAVSGEAGAGKTRLVNEALASFPVSPVTIFAGICAPYGETNVWSPIATALLRHLDLEIGWPADRVRAVCVDKGVELYDFERDDPMLARFVEGVLHMLGYPSELDALTPAQSRETVFSIVVEGLRRRSQTGPLVLWIDDLQWADPLIVDLLQRIARSLVDRAVLIITAQRDGAEIDWPPTFDHPTTIRLPLDPLDRAEAGMLVSVLLGPDLTESLTDELYERSGGNLLFLTELAALARAQPDSRELPGSLRALISARLDQLSAAQRAIIDNASVLGASGTVDSLHKFALAMDQRIDPDDLEHLVDAGMLEIDGQSWRFRSDVVREVAYQTLTKLVRAQRHAGTAAVMATWEPVPVELVAHHAACAAELVGEIGPVPEVPPNIADVAVRLLCDAARRSLDSGAFSQTLRHTTRALDLGVSDESLARELLVLRAQALTERRSADAARVAALEALEAAVAAGDRFHEGIARRLLGILDQRQGELAAARLELGESVEIFRALHDDIELAASLRERGFAEVFGGSLADAEWLLGEAGAISEQLGDVRGQAWVQQHQAWAAFLSGDTDLAELRLTAAADAFDQLGDRTGRGWALGLLAYVRFYQRDFVGAEQLAVSVRAEAAAVGDQWAQAMMDSLVASIRVWTMQFAEAAELARRALVTFRSLSDRFGMVQALGPRLRALVALGRTHDAERGLEEVLAISDMFGDLSFPAMTVAGASVHMGLGPRGLANAELAVERGARMGTDGAESRVTLALALCQSGRPDDALIELDRVDRTFPYSLAVGALARAMVGDSGTAIELAEALLAWDDRTYLDEVVAAVAAAGAARWQGDREAMVAWLDRALSVAARAGDHAMSDLVAGAAVAFGSPEHGRDCHLLSPGWQTVVDTLAAPA